MILSVSAWRAVRRALGLDGRLIPVEAEGLSEGISDGLRARQMLRRSIF